MFWPGIGFTSASCSAYCIQNGVKLPGLVSPGSSQAGGIVTYTANLISPSGLACAFDDPGPATMAATPRIMAEAKFCHPFINTGFPACARDADSRLLPASPRRMRFDRPRLSALPAVQDGIMAASAVHPPAAPTTETDRSS